MSMIRDLKRNGEIRFVELNNIRHMIYSSGNDGIIFISQLIKSSENGVVFGDEFCNKIRFNTFTTLYKEGDINTF